MAECYILETSIFIESLEDTTYDDDNIVSSYGFKDKSTTDTPYGGMSKQVIKTGKIPSECSIFSFESNNGMEIDEDEGISLVLVNDLSATPLVEVTPFGEIDFKLGTKESDPVYTMGIRTTTGGGTRYSVHTPAADRQQIMNWFEDNLNNTPQIRLTCYTQMPAQSKA